MSGSIQTPFHVTRRSTPSQIIDPRALTLSAKRGMRLVDLRRLGYLPNFAGGAAEQNVDNAHGYNAAADIVTQTADGVDLNVFWREFQETMALANAERQRMIDILTFPVVNPTERVPQVSGARFEKASEYGEPVGIRPRTAYFTLGYDMDWYDLAARFTWKFLADATRDQVDAINAMALDADNAMIFEKVMEALFLNENRLADIDGEQDVNVYSLYNGDDGTVPPRYKSYVHDANHNHYLTTGSAEVDSGDLDAMYEHLVHHGYSKVNGMTVFLMANRQQVNTIKTFRIDDGDGADFIPAAGSPGMYLPRDVELLGGQPAANFRGLNVAGSYGDFLVIEEDTIPPKYMTMIATGGRANLNNPVGFRQHRNASLQGLRLVKGPNPDYPLIDSFYNRGFGTGIRQRGGAVIMQVKETGDYVPPTFI